MESKETFVITTYNNNSFTISITHCRIADDRGLRCGAPPDALGPRAPALCLHGGGERGPRSAQVPGHQGLGARRRQVLPGEARGHRLPRLGPAAAAAARTHTNNRSTLPAGGEKGRKKKERMTVERPVHPVTPSGVPPEFFTRRLTAHSQTPTWI